MANQYRYTVDVGADGERRRFVIRETGGSTRFSHELPAAGQREYLDFYAAAADALGTRRPRNRMDHAAPPPAVRHRPLLTQPLSPDVRYGYGDPAVLRVAEEQAWYMVVTSNDAAGAFPILRTRDLLEWEMLGCVFPHDRKPAWAEQDAAAGDYWAPELHRVGDEYMLCFSAREPDRSFSIGIARSDRPEGPFACPPEPLLRGDVIDAHLFVGRDGRAILFWKRNSNAVWPRVLARMLGDDPSLIEALFASDGDRETAGLTAALWRWAVGQPMMEQFVLLQPLMEAVADDFAATRARLTAMGTADAAIAAEAMTTPIFAQRLSPDGSVLVGVPQVVLVNDQEWEGRLIEGPWLTEQDGRFYLFYAGNDFATDEYGVGVAVADDPFGPYRKGEGPLLRSDSDWAGPGHPSVAPGADGRPQLFYHAFFPGHAGYKEFRALLTTKLRFTPEGVEVGAPAD